MLEFWGSRYDCMNDPFDCQYSHNKIYPLMMNVAKELRTEKGIIPKDAIEPIKADPFVVSFSKKKDDFLMWRMYNAKVSLIIDKGFVDEPLPNCALVECEYVDDSSDMKIPYLKIVNKLNDCLNISAETYRVTTFIKHKSFETEGEVRLATWDYYNEGEDKVQLADCANTKDLVEEGVCSRVNKDRIILYKKFHLDMNALVGLIIHTYSEIEYEMLSMELKALLKSKSYSREVYENISQTNAYPLF